MPPKIVARWVSRSGKYTLTVYDDSTYEAVGARGFRPDLTIEQLVQWCERHVNDFQPDNARTPMHRVF